MKRIFLIDADEELRLAVRQHLSRGGYDVDAASSVDDGLDAAASFDPSVLLLSLTSTGSSHAQNASSSDHLQQRPVVNRHGLIDSWRAPSQRNGNETRPMRVLSVPGPLERRPPDAQKPRLRKGFRLWALLGLNQ